MNFHDDSSKSTNVWHVQILSICETFTRANIVLSNFSTDTDQGYLTFLPMPFFCLKHRRRPNLNCFQVETIGNRPSNAFVLSFFFFSNTVSETKTRRLLNDHWRHLNEPMKPDRENRRRQHNWQGHVATLIFYGWACAVQKKWRWINQPKDQIQTHAHVCIHGEVRRVIWEAIESLVATHALELRATVCFVLCNCSRLFALCASARSLRAKVQDMSVKLQIYIYVFQKLRRCFEDKNLSTSQQPAPTRSVLKVNVFDIWYEMEARSTYMVWEHRIFSS